MELHTTTAASFAFHQDDALPTVEAHLQTVLRGGGIHEALDSLQSVAQALRAGGDARAIFPDIYSIITEKVEQVLERGGFFQEPAFISRLAGRFASLYLDSLARSLTGRPQSSAAWTLAYHRADADGVLPVEHAGLGISAHINFDLTLGIYETIRKLGASADEAALARFKHDHDAVNTLLEQSLPECLVRLIEVYGCPATSMFTGRMRRFATRRIMKVLSKWRNRVWDNVLALLNAPSEVERIAVVARMERVAHREGLRLNKLCRTGGMLVH